MAEEERRRAFVERVTETLKVKLKDGTLGAEGDESKAGGEGSSSEEDQVYGPALPNNRKAPVKLPVLNGTIPNHLYFCTDIQNIHIHIV